MKSELESVIAIARAAGEITLEYFGKNPEVSLKPCNSPVTQADLDADAHIREALFKRFPAIPIISEEGKNLSYEERKSWSQFWLVDPLDGTKEFIKGREDYTVNIALVSNGIPTLGVILAPAKKLLYYGAKGLGAWKAEAMGAPIQIFASDPPRGGPFTIVESRSHPSEELENFLKDIPVKKRVQVGSSLKFCYVAEGIADIYPRMGPMMEWDVAAGDAIYRNSGRGKDLSTTLTYNKPDLRSGFFVLGEHHLSQKKEAPPP